jgi:hypothetical protein
LGGPLIAEAIADVFLDAIEHCRWRPLQRVQLAFRWLEDAARSPPGLELLTDDGSRYSGVFVIVQNRPVYQLAAKQFANQRATRQHDPRRHSDLFHGYSGLDEGGPYAR